MTVVVIDPGTRTVSELPDFPLPEAPMIHVPGVGLVLHQPQSVFNIGIRPFFFEPLGVLMGRTFVVNPERPVEPLVTWVKALMVINHATAIIPYPSHRNIP